MEYVEGKTLDQLIGRKGLRLNEAETETIRADDEKKPQTIAGLIVGTIAYMSSAASIFRPLGVSPCWLIGAVDRHSIAAVRRAVLEGFDFLHAGNR
jgi:hypothetical protein